MNKQCSKCKVILNIEMFYYYKSRGKFGSNCKKCENKRSFEYRKNNVKKIQSFRKSEKSREYQKVYMKAYSKTAKRIKWSKNYDKNRGKLKERRKYKKIYAKIYSKTPKRKKWAKNYIKNKLHTDIKFKLAFNLRQRIRRALKNNYKIGSAVRDLGCSIPELKIYIEKQFKKGMTWKNWGVNGWHLDHRLPLDSFDLTSRREFKQAIHFSNLQPMWWKDNLIKSNKIQTI